MDFYLYAGIGAICGLFLLMYFNFIKRRENGEGHLLEYISNINIKDDALEKHAEELSRNHNNVNKNNCKKRLMNSLDKSYKDILSTYDFIEREMKNKKDVVSASEWLLDNLYLIEKDYKDIKQNMPEKYYKELPVMHSGIMKGYPRVYHISMEIIGHTDGNVDGHIIKRFIKAYEKNTILTMGELWALPIMIRIALIQDIGNICNNIEFIEKEKARGEKIADRIINAFNEEKIPQEIDKLQKEGTDFTPYFTERLLKILRDNGVDNLDVYRWIDENLQKKNTDSNKIVLLEHHKETSFQISIGNCVNSLRKIEALNWKDYFESLSEVEAILREDPAEVYKLMDFQSRDYYRHKLEMISKRLKVSEIFVANKVIECAKNIKSEENTQYLKHVGYYIIDDGKEELIKKLKPNEGFIHKIINIVKRNSVKNYIASIIAGTCVLMLIFLELSYINDYDFKLWKYIMAIIILLVPCSEIVLSIFNWSATNLAPIRFIPKLELKNGINEENSTVVIIPTLINSVKRAKELIESLEVYYLANTEKHLYFALLGDFKDSEKEVEDEDEIIIKETLKTIKNINIKYGFKDGNEKFFFLCRYRQLNKNEGHYLGWERKRGKIEEFNELLRGSKDTSYNVISSNLETLNKVKYVITLDADTELPRDTAKKLVGAMAHILNQPHVDKYKKRVFRGHGLLQPKISVSTLSANKTLFSRIFSGETGIDTYSTAVSDVYQDLFGEGIFTGKGIYHLDTFLYMLRNEIPENTILSHDLLEGSYVRAGLVSDVELIDGYPAYYNASAKRLHRWVRGDWQLLRWLKRKSPLNLLSKWKILDNLRRSLLSPSIVLLIIFGLCGILPDGTDKWFMVAFLAVMSPILFDVTEAVVAPIKGINLSGRIKNDQMVLEQFLLIFIFIPYQAYLMTDAIVRTLYRLCISKRNLLQWQTAADVESSVGRKPKDFFKSMWVGAFIALLIIIMAFNNSITMGVIMLIPCILWFLSPYVAYYISKERATKRYIMDKDEKALLRRFSRKTWAYFEDFINEENNWLGPDNFQEEPSNGLAHRTSPTNMGMAITSNLVAMDFGYIGMLEGVKRIENIIYSMDTLDKYHGHYYNWYNTKTKEPLYPRFISTVDSGNLVGYLWLTAETLKEYLNKPFINFQYEMGILDTLKLAEEELSKHGELKEIYIPIKEQLEKNNINIFLWKELLKSLMEKVKEVERIDTEKFLYWNYKLKKDVQRYVEELEEAFPWVKQDTEVKADTFIEMEKKLECIIEKYALVNLGEQLNKFSFELEENNDGKDLKELIEHINNSRIYITSIVEKVKSLIKQLNHMAQNTDFTMLYDKSRELFSIGYDMENSVLNNSFYDLLASECRQASFVAIAKGDVDKQHWFKLGRAMTFMGKSKGLVSWSGTMFEYFMPLLVMKSYPGTLLNRTYWSVIEGQKKYCSTRGVPWGISESAFYNFDINKNYQYKAFGVPGIGLKRGLVNEVVISPYSSVLALQKDLEGSLQNIKKLLSEGLEGIYGFYEAVDYTKDRLINDNKKEIVKCFMIHHEGMSLMALDNVINENILQRRFHNIPKVKATELLLQERVPKVILYDREHKFHISEGKIQKQKIIVRKFTGINRNIPETHLMSNNDFSIMISSSGSGYSKKGDVFLYRWREDVTEDNTGLFLYVKDIKSKEYWSTTYEPCKKTDVSYETTFSLDKAKFNNKHKDIEISTEVTVSYEDNAEVRRIILNNCGKEDRELEITTYCEVTLSGYDGDLVHPAFSNLFVTTEFVQNPKTVLATRRPRAAGKKQPWMMQTFIAEGENIGELQYESSRLNFIGRGRNKKNPIAMEDEIPLKNTIGVVLDPILSLRRIIKVPAGKNCKLALVTAIGENRGEAINLGRKYNEMQNVDRAFTMAWTGAQVEMKYLGMKSPQANLYQSMASKILFTNPLMRKREEFIKNISKGQSTLWGYGISGDLPIILLIVREEKHIDYVRQMLRAHEYLALKGLKTDLLILNLEGINYHEPVQRGIMDLIYSSYARNKENKPGGVFVLNKARIKEEDIDLLKALARILIDSKDGFINTQLQTKDSYTSTEDLIVKKKEENWSKVEKFNIPPLEFYNEYGGFNLKENEYIILLNGEKNTPAPWINVISNGNFGFHISESGSAYTWCENSRENKITPWNNDWISDTPSEALFLRDEERGNYWSITPKPIRDQGEYIITHGFGYTEFKHESNGIMAEELMFVPMEERLKLIKVKLKNNSKEVRNLSLAYYAHLVMGVVPQHSSQYVSTHYNEKKSYIYGTNSYSMHFGKLKAYLKVIGLNDVSYTGNRTEFIGRGKDIEEPEALKKIELSNTVGAGMDPCLAYEGKISIKPLEEKEFIVILGEEQDASIIERCLEKYSNLEEVNRALEGTKDYWKKLLGKVQVKTPNKGMNIMLNGWLMYQTLSCRIWARTAFYQSGGAYGFRDQLQDMMPFAYLDSKFTRDHIIYSSGRQFLEGDVQHWWHPGVDSGIRTRFSDDLLWLPYVTIDYIKNTGDYSILDEEAYYLEDSPLSEGEDERYNISPTSNVKGDIYEHCYKAIDKALKFGAHNIPLMGSGDWNDGMSTIGNQGSGESVWLGWFLYSILKDFTSLCEYKEDKERMERYEHMKEFILKGIEDNAWDGKWYRRAYFDDGTPLGSSSNEECSIDSLAQSWAVISGGGSEERIKSAIDSLEKYLIKEDKGLILLLTPPFYKSSLEPGYIKGYVPGVRENGGQYTHASTWVILAMAKLGRGSRALQLFNMINPINHTRTYSQCETYKTEPYVMTADVYSTDTHLGRGGWSWYTGTSGWMYRVGIEGILGLKLKGNKGFTIEPSMPEDWQEYEIKYTKEEAIYNIKVQKGVKKEISLDGKILKENIIPYIKEGEHEVIVIV